jgi:hypothetical protein
MRTLLLGAICALAVQAMTADAAIVTFTDSEFSDADWTTAIFRQDPGIAYSAKQVLSGGHPGSYLQFSGTYSGIVLPAIVLEAHWLNGAVIDPTVDGAIQTLRYSADFGNITSNNNILEFYLALFQNGSIYGAGGWGLQDSPLTWYSLTDLSAPWFAFYRLTGTGPNNPDFSGAGAPIQFGFITGIYFTGTGSTGSKVGGIDDFSVKIETTAQAVPEPFTLLVWSGLGAMGLIAAWRRRKRAA